MPLTTKIRGRIADMLDKPGDRLEKALRTVGITKDRVEAWLGKPCKCGERQAKLNAIGAWAKRVLAGQTEDAEVYLNRIMNESCLEPTDATAQPCQGCQ